MSNLQNLSVQSTTEPQENTANELAHITEEVYKKNAELAHTNKVLSLLRKIDDIVLSTVTDAKQVAQQVADLVVNEDSFRIVSILMRDKDNSLFTLAVSNTGGEGAAAAYCRSLLEIKISASENTENNGILKVINNKTEQIFVNLEDVYAPFITKILAANITNSFAIHTTIVYPLIVRGVAIGVMVISRVEPKSELSVYEKDIVDRLAGVIGIAMDNSMMYKEVSESNEKLKALDKLKDEFISVTSHELRTPMTIIKNYIWRILNDPNEAKLSDKNIDRLKKAYESTEREISLVNDILDVSKLESGAMSFVLENFGIVAFCQEVSQELTDSFSKKQIHTVIQEQGEIQVHADKNRVRQVLTNLLTNAYKFSPENGQILIKFLKTDKFIQVTVVDNGIGIREEDIPKLFSKFGRLDNPLSPNYQTTGTGLGLFLSKKIIERLGGQITVTSVFGKGSNFTFSLPVA